MTLSTLTPYNPIPNGSQATTGLFNSRMQAIQQNIDALNTSGSAGVSSGTGSPEGVVSANVGTPYSQSDGTQGVDFWHKVFGIGSTGWQPLGTSDGRLNVKDFGAKGDLATDDYAAIQAALTQASLPGSGNTVPTVYLPPGWYKHSKPLWMSNFQPRMEGAGRLAATVIQGTYAYGPEIVIFNSGNTVTQVAALLTGGGQAYSTQTSITTTTQYFNLRDVPTMELNGLAAFTAEATINSDAHSDTYHLFSSSGKFLNSEPLHSCLDIYNQATNNPTTTLTAVLTTTGSRNTIVSTSVFSAGHNAHVALSWGGSVATLYINGASVGTCTATGTILQDHSEEVSLGPVLTFYPESGIAGSGMVGRYDSVRFSGIARYGANFTAPTAKFASDSNTLLLMNFEDTVAGCSLARTRNGNAWMYLRCFDVRGTQDPVVQDLELFCGTSGTSAACRIGIISTQAPQPHYRRIRFANYRNGLMMLSNCFSGNHPDLHFVANATAGASRAGVVEIGTSGDNQFDNLSISGGRFGIAANTSDTVLIKPFWAFDTNTIFGALFRDTGGNAGITVNTIIEPGFDLEQGVSSALTACLILSGPADTTCVGGQYQTLTPSLQPPILFDGGISATFVGGFYNSNSTTLPTVLRVFSGLTLPQQQILFVNPSLTTYITSLCATPGVAISIGSAGASLTTGTALNPTYAFSSDQSLGWYSSGVSTMALSYGTLNLNQSRVVSVRTAASLDSVSLAVNESAFAFNASAATFAIRSGGTVWFFSSSASTKG